VCLCCCKDAKGAASRWSPRLDNGGKPLVVYNLHLESKGTEQLRFEQLEEVLDGAQRYPADTPIIVAGDFNTFVFHSRLIPRLRQAGFRSALGDRRVRMHVIVGALDWVFVRGSIKYGRRLRVSPRRPGPSGRARLLDSGC
jgi:endonuclease/exonuclease/phosphatase (EEP) superfamily protein YafD